MNRVFPTSFQQPRTLAGYREHFGGNRQQREGFIEVKCVPIGEIPAQYEWDRRYIVLRDAIVYWRSENSTEEDLVLLVRLDEVHSVKTALSIQSKTIIVLSSATVCLYMYSPSEEDVKDWLFCFHTAVIDFLLDGDCTSNILSNETHRQTATNARSSLNTRDIIPGRSRSSNGFDCEEPSSSFWDSSSPSNLNRDISAHDIVYETFEGTQNISGIGKAIGKDSYCRSLASPGTIKQSAVPFVDSLVTNSDDNTLDRIGTRQFVTSLSVNTHIIDDSANSGELPDRYSPSGSKSLSSRGHPVIESTSCSMSGIEGSAFLSGSSFARSLRNGPSEGSNFSRSGSPGTSHSRNGTLIEGTPSTSLSSKRVPNIRLKLESESTLHSTVRSNHIISRRSDSSDSPSCGILKEIEVIPRSGKYVPPHLRKGQSRVAMPIFDTDHPKASVSASSPLNFSDVQTSTAKFPFLTTEEDDTNHIGRKYSESSDERGRFYGTLRYSSGDFIDDTMFFEMEGHSQRKFSKDNRHSNLKNDTSLFETCDELVGIYDTKNPVYGSAAMQGCRITMEDFDIAIPRFKDCPCLGFYAVFDGHCGSRVAELARSHTHKFCLEDERFGREWPQGSMDAVTQAFMKVESAVFKMAASNPDKPLLDGSCALVALVHYADIESDIADGVAVANIGDSRGIVYHEGIVHVMSEEHSPSRADEKERIESLGGWVTVEREMLIEKLHHMDLTDPIIKERAKTRFNYSETSRVNGELAVSRTLGDIDYKKPAQDSYEWFFPPDHPGSESKCYEFSGDLVIADPEWKYLEIVSDPNAEIIPSFLIIACDGLWDVISNEEAVGVCLRSRSVQQASAALLDIACRMGTVDNVTVLVIELRPWV